MFCIDSVLFEAYSLQTFEVSIMLLCIIQMKGNAIFDDGNQIERRFHCFFARAQNEWAMSINEGCREKRSLCYRFVNVYKYRHAGIFLLYIDVRTQITSKIRKSEIWLSNISHQSRRRYLPNVSFWSPQ